MRKKNVAKILHNLPGFSRKGLFFLGTCNDEVIGGYCLDAQPNNIYIWKFVLPSYDNLDFLHLSLGKRILTFPHDEDKAGEDAHIQDFLRRDWSELCRVNNSESLIGYMNSEGLDGTYAAWVRFLTHIHLREFSTAEQIYRGVGVAEKFSALRAISQSFKELSEAEKRGGWESCLVLLDVWVSNTKRRLSLPKTHPAGFRPYR
jgi:hypothetical protein